MISCCGTLDSERDSARPQEGMRCFLTFGEFEGGTDGAEVLNN